MLIIKHLKYTKSSLPHPRNTITTVIPAKSQIAKAEDSHFGASTVSEGHWEE